MNLIFNINNEKALSISKHGNSLLFGNNFNDNMNNCSKIYLCNKKQIIGECTFDKVEKIKHSKLGVTLFILYWAKNIKKDESLVNDIKTALDYDLPGYDKSMNLSYMYNLWSLDVLKSTGKMPMLFDLTKEEYLNYEKNQSKADKLIYECDEWLYEIGFYNGDDESNFKNYIAISNIMLYNKNIELSEFKNKDNKTISAPPKTWCYTLN